VKNATGPIQRAQTIGRKGAGLGQRVVCERSMADGAALGTAAIAEE
jgi:hypothetical protein